MVDSGECRDDKGGGGGDDGGGGSREGHHCSRGVNVVIYSVCMCV